MMLRLGFFQSVYLILLITNRVLESLINIWIKWCYLHNFPILKFY